jgi:hypothetical protein
MTGSQVIAPQESYPNEKIAIWVLFDLRDAGAVEELHHARAVWQGQSDIEALDEDHFALLVRPGWLSEQAA